MSLVRITEEDQNSYLIVNKDNCDIIDPGFCYDKIVLFLKENNLKVRYVLLTHGHIDHIKCIPKLYKTNGPFELYIGKEEEEFLTNSYYNLSDDFKTQFQISFPYKTFSDKDVLDQYQFFHTPGHTKGSYCISYSKYLFTGDTLFKGTVGRFDLPTASLTELKASCIFISSKFKRSTIILPGHFDKSTIKEELATNRHLINFRRHKK